MKTRLNRILVFILLLAHVFHALGTEPCPLCGGNVRTAGTISHEHRNPSKNLTVWNGSMCANWLFGDDSLVCTQCWHAYSVKLKRWERSSEIPDSFRAPLTAAIKKVPLPAPKEIKSRVVYTHEMDGAQLSESVAMWCSDSEAIISRFRDYASAHNLEVRIENRGRIPGQVFIALRIVKNNQ